MKQQMLEKEVAELKTELFYLRAAFDAGKPMYEVGKTYQQISGDSVTIVGKSNHENSYETVYWIQPNGDKCHAYNRRDYGRVAGTSTIDKDPRSLVPLWRDYVALYIVEEDKVQKLKQQVIDLVNQQAELVKDQNALRESLTWFIQEDDTRDEEGNAYWIRGLEKARKTMATSLNEPYEKRQWNTHY